MFKNGSEAGSGKRNRRIVVVSIFVLVMIALLGIPLFQKNSNHQALEEQQADKVVMESIKELEVKEGSYNDKHIVLRNTSKLEAEKIAEELGVEVRTTGSGNYAVLYLDEDTSIKDIYLNEAYKKYVGQMSPDYFAVLCDSEQTVWTSDKTVDTTFTHRANQLNLGEAWDITRGAGSSIAVIDTGIDTDNPHLQSKISPRSFNATEGKIVSDYDVSVVEDGDLMTYHGTQVASVIAADYDAETGIGGIAPETELIVIKLEMNENGEVSGSDIAFGIAYAIECDVDIINMSFSMSNGGYEDLTELAVDSDIICVAAAGNSSTSTNVWPASDINVIGVGAVQSIDEKDMAATATIGLSTIDNDEQSSEPATYVLTEKSNYGENTTLVAIDRINAATGHEELEYDVFGNTSCSAAMASGALGLYLSVNDHQTFQEIVEVLEASSKDLGVSGLDWKYGAGLLDINALIVEEKGTITYETLTEEAKGSSHIFVKGHTLQTAPEPERNYTVFDGWNYDINCLEEYDNLTDVLYEDLTVYAAWANEDDTDAFSYFVKDDNTIEILGYRGKRRYVTIPATIEGKIVTSIGERAFYGNNRMRMITLPETLRVIGPYAFSKCTRLLEISIPSTVTSIQEGAFMQDPRLGNAAFFMDGALYEIGDYAFAECGGLTELLLPAGLQMVNGSAFYSDQGITSIAVAETNAVLYADGKALYGIKEDGTHLIYFAGGISGSYSVEQNTVSVDYLSFALSQLKQVVFPSGLEKVGKDAFAYSRLTSIDIPDSVESIGEECFACCSNLNTVHLGQGIGTISGRAFYQCNALVGVINDGTITYIGESAFSGCGKLQSVDFINCVSKIGMYSFAGCGSIDEVLLPSTLTEIGDGAFMGCSGLERLVFGDGIQLELLERGIFVDCIKLKDITLPEGLKEISEWVFGNTALEEIHIPSSVEIIGKGVFGDCPSLTTITVASGNEHYVSIDNVLFELDEEGNASILHTYPGGKSGAYAINNTVKKIGDAAFYKAQKLSSITFGENVEIIGDEAFTQCRFTTASFNDKLSEVGSSAFRESALQSVTFGTGVKLVGTNAFAFCYDLSNVVLNEGLEELKGNVFSCTGIAQIVLPDSLVSMGQYCLASCSNLTSITIPRNLISLGQYAFANNINLSSVEFAEGCLLSRINMGAFSGTGISSITIPASVQTMGQEVFRYCSNLQSVTFAENNLLRAVPARVFLDTPLLSSIVFEEGSQLQIIEARAFEHLTALTTVDISKCTMLKVIDNYAFHYCDHISEFVIPDGVEEIGRYAFYKCNALTGIVIPSSVQFIGRYAFAGITSIKVYFNSAMLPNNLQEDWDYGIKGYYLGTGEKRISEEWEYTVLNDDSAVLLKYLGNSSEVIVTTVDGHTISAIGAYILDDNSSVTRITLPESLISITDYAFYNASNLEEIVLPDSLVRIGKYAFANSGIRSVSFGEASNLQYIDAHAFENAKNLESIIIPAAVLRIDTAAFGDSGLNSVSFTENSVCSYIGKSAFIHTRLSSIVLPDSIEKIDYHAFEGTSQLESVQFGNGNLQLFGYAFYNSGLTSIVLPENIEYVGEYCFASCKNLLSFTVSENNRVYSSIDSVLFNKSASKLLQYPAARQQTYSIPDNTEVLGFGAFEGCKVSEIVIGNNSMLNTIGYRAFYNCEYLTQINIPDNVRSIDYYAFAYCKRLARVSITENSVMNGIYEGAFYNCEALQNVLIPDGVNEIGEYAFYGCEALSDVRIGENCVLKGVFAHAFELTGVTSLDLPDSVVEIGDNAFAQSKLESFEIKKTVVDLGKNVFYRADQLQELQIANIEKTNYVLKEDLFGGVVPNLNKIVFTDTDIIPDSCCKDMSCLKIVETDEELKVIGKNAFYNCSALESVTGIINVSQIGPGAFYACGMLASVDNTKNVEVFDSACFSECLSLKSIAFDSARLIGKNAFRVCGLESVDLSGESIESIGESAFANSSSLKTVLISSLAEGGCELGPSCFSQTGLEKVEIGEGVRSIEKCAFFDCQLLKKVVLPDSLKNIGIMSFDSCIRLEDIIFGTGLISIGEKAFNSTAIQRIILPKGLVSIGSMAFYPRNEDNDFYKPYVWIPNTVTSIGSKAFVFADLFFEGDSLPAEVDEYWCGDGSTVTIHLNAEPLQVTEEYEYMSDGGNGVIAVRYLGEQENITVDSIEGKPVTGIHTMCFINATQLKSLVVGDSVVTIGDQAFRYCGLESVHIGDGVESIGWGAFDTNTNLADLYLGDHITTIGESAFSWCRSLRSFTTPDSLRRIGDHAFALIGGYNNSEPLTVTLNNGLEYIGSEAFYHSRIDHIIIPDSVSTIENRAFVQCEIREINIPKGLDEIPAQFAVQCRCLTSITIPDNIEKIGSQAFDSCSNLNQIVFDGNNLSEIGEYAFRSNRVKRVIIPNGVTSLGIGAFDSTFTEVISVPDTVTYMGDGYNNSNMIIGFAADHLPEGLSDGWDANIKAYYLNYTITDLMIDADTGLEYYISNGEVTVTGYYGDAVNLDIDVLGEYPVTVIDEEAFKGNQSITSVRIGSNVKRIRDKAFLECLALETIQFDHNSALYEIGDNAFQKCSEIKDLVLPSSVRTIGEYAFSECTNVGPTLVIPFSTENVGQGAFSLCNGLNKVVFAGSKVKTIGTVFSSCRNLKEVILEEGLEEMGGTFNGCSSLESINIPESLRHLDKYSFDNCPAIENVNGLRYIDKALIGYDTTLGTAAVIREGTSVMVDNVLGGCSSLESVSLPGSLKVVPLGAFAGTSIKDIVIPNSVDTIPRFALGGMDQLETLSLPVIGDDGIDLYYLFGGAGWGMNGWQIPTCLQTIIVTGDGDYSSINNNQIQELRFTGTIKEISVDCPNVTDFSFPHDVERITKLSTALTEISVPETVSYIGEIGSDSLQSIDLPAALEHFDIISGQITELYIPENTQYIGTIAAPNLTYLRVPFSEETIQRVGCDVFWGTKYIYKIGGNVETVEICGEPTELPDGAFRDCDRVKKIILPDTIEVFNRCAFDGCISLTSLNLPKNLKDAGGEYVFRHVPIKKMVLPDGVTSFASYEALEEVTITNPAATFSLNVASDLKTITIPYLGYEPGGYLPLQSLISSNSMQSLETVILLSSCDYMESNAFEGITGVTIYCYAEEAAGWPRGWNNGNKVYYLDEWSMIDFVVNGQVVSSSIQNLGDPIRLPAKSLRTVPDTKSKVYTFVGWDINNDGVADSLLTAHLKNYHTAVAVYDIIQKADRVVVDDVTVTSTGQGSSVIDGTSGREGITKAVVSVDSSDVIEANTNSLEIISDVGSVVLNEAAINNAVNGNDALAVEITRIDTDLHSEASQGDALYDLSLISNGESIAFNNNGGVAAVTVPYEIMEDSIPVVTHIAEDGSTVNMDAEYEDSTGEVTFTTNHFSLFKVSQVALENAGISVSPNGGNFPDAAFRAYVAENFDIDHDGYLTDGECEAVTEIDVTGKNIGSLVGIEHFCELVTLVAENNELTTLDLSANTNLKYLSCGGNNLTVLDVTHNTALTTLSCYENILSTLDISMLTDLEYLDCNDNSLTELDLHANAALTSLDCSGNLLSEIDVSMLPDLCRLECYDMPLQNLTLGSQENLVWLSCYEMPEGFVLDISGCPLILDAYLNGTQTFTDIPGFMIFVTYMSGSSTLEIDPQQILVTESAKPSNITSTSVDFNGKMHLITYIKLSEEVMSDADAYITTTFNGVTTTHSVSELIRNLDSQGRVKVRQEMYAAMMRDEMTLRVLSGAGEIQPLTYKDSTTVIDSFVYTALEYLKDRQENSSNPYMVELARAAELYGTAVQVKFNYHTEQLTAEDTAAIEEAAEAIIIPASFAETLTGTMPEGVTKKTKTVMFESDNSLRMYFYIDDARIDNFTFTLDGNPVTPIKKESGKYFVQQTNIASGLLSQEYTFTVSDTVNTCAIRSSVLGYAYDRQNNSSDASMICLAKLLYRYSQTANDYFDH